MFRLVLVFLFTFAPVAAAVQFGRLEVRGQLERAVAEAAPEVSGLVTLGARPEEVVRAAPDLYSIGLLGNDLTALRLRQQLRASSPVGFDAYTPNRNSPPLGGALFLRPPATE